MDYADEVGSLGLAVTFKGVLQSSEVPQEFALVLGHWSYGSYPVCEPNFANVCARVQLFRSRLCHGKHGGDTSHVGQPWPDAAECRVSEWAVRFNAVSLQLSGFEPEIEGTGTTGVGVFWTDFEPSKTVEGRYVAWA